MNSCNILWVDDEVSSLKSHILFLEQKGFSVNTVTNGYDAIDMVVKYKYDIIFLNVASGSPNPSLLRLKKYS